MTPNKAHNQKKGGKGLLAHANPKVIGRFVRRQVKKAGSAPGTMVYTGTRAPEPIHIEMLSYDADGFTEVEFGVDEVEKLAEARITDRIEWIDVHGLNDVEVIEKIGSLFDIHPLVLEDVVHVGQRPKFEEYDGHLFMVIPMLGWDEARSEITEEQVSLIVGDSWVLSFQERRGDCFDGVRERIRAGRTRIRGKGSVYLGYALLDAIVDAYFASLEKVGDLTEALELDVLDEPSEHTRLQLHKLKRELLAARRAIWPVRELVGGFQRTESDLVEDSLKVFVRDVYDHVTQALETVETLREVASGALDLYLSVIANRANEVMKVLTIMASIFIPLTFLAGIYGMNFQHMPELAYSWAYPTLLGVMLVLGLGMVVYFRRKGWM